MPDRPNVRNRIALLLALLWMPLMAPLAADKSPPPADDPARVATEVGGLLARLTEAVRLGDAEGMDGPLCNDWRSAAMALRQERLGIGAQGAWEERVAAAGEANRQRVVAHFRRLARQGREVRALEVSRIQFHATGGSAGSERLVLREAGQLRYLPIEASGLVEVTCQPGDHVFDLGVTRIDGRWCLSPP